MAKIIAQVQEENKNIQVNERSGKIDGSNKHKKGEDSTEKQLDDLSGNNSSTIENKNEQKIEVNVNDKFLTKEDAILAVSEFSRFNSFNYDIVENTRTITFVCIGKKEFNCDALIHLFFKKKDNCFTVKKVKLVHKCPPEMDSANFIENEIKKLGENRIGEIVSLMNKRNIKIGYSGVYDALCKKNSEKIENFNSQDDEKENHPNKKRKRVSKQPHAKNDQIESQIFQSAQMENVNTCFSHELVLLNPNIFSKGDEKSIFVSFNIFQFLRPVTELKIIPRKSGYIIFTLCFDGHDQPVVGAFTVTENDNIQQAYNEHHDRVSPLLMKDNIQLIELKNAFLMKDASFFIKTRSICKATYDKCKNTNLIVKIWDIANSNCEYENIPELEGVLSEHGYLIDKNSEITEEYGNISLQNYRRSNQVLYGLENMSDPDLDLLYFNYSSGEVLEATNTVIKLVGDCATLRKKKENGFGENIKKKMNRSIEIQYTVEEIADSHNVTIDGEIWNVSLNEIFCTCGYFQEWRHPCTHGLILIRYLGLNPITFVSEIYNLKREIIYRDLIPVINENVKINISNNLLLRRGPGRPKKGNSKRYDEVHATAH